MGRNHQRRDRIAGSNSIHETRHHPTQRERRRGTDGDAGSGQEHTAVNGRADHITALCTERDADADFREYVVPPRTR
jgi:hypothetical protein